MSDYQSGPFVSQDELDRLGHPLPEGMNVPSVETPEYVVDDNDSQSCYGISQHDLAPMYIDNPTAASPVQPDVWTLETDNEWVTLTYQSGAQYAVRLGDIDLSGGSDPDTLVKHNGLVYPMSGGQVQLNPHTTPRLSHMRAWILEQTAQRAEERLKMAELVAIFAQQVANLGSAADTVGNIQKGLPFNGNDIVRHRQ